MNIGRQCLVGVTLTIAAAMAHASDLRDGAVYLMTNQATNAVIAYERADNGTLTRVANFATGGSGNPAPEGTDPPTDPLASQGSLVLTHDGRFLLAANAGSNQVSVFEVRRGGLRLVPDEGFGRHAPDQHRHPQPPGVRAQRRRHAEFHWLHHERIGATYRCSRTRRRSLPSGLMADPAQISFSYDGKVLAVTEKMSNLIATFPVRSNGLTRSPVITPSNGLTPFGFAFDGRGHLIVSEAAGGLPGESSASSYGVNAEGVLESISDTIPNFQTAACWVVVTGNARYAFISNTGSGEVSSFRNRPDGRLALIDATASDTAPMSLPIDMALSSDSRYLYVHLAGRKGIAVFRVESDGSLTRRQSVLGLPFGAQGIAAY